MKILYHHRIASKDGQYVHVEELTNALKKLGHEIIMVGPSVVETDDFGADGGFVAVLKKYMPGVAYELLELMYSFVAYFKLAKAYKQHKPDILYERYNLYLPSGVWLKKRFKIPMILEVNAPLYEERSKYGKISIKWLAKWSENYAWRSADIVLPVTGVLADYIRKIGVSDDRINVIPNGIDWSKFESVPDVVTAKENLGISNKLVLGFVGFVREWHGLEKMVDLIAVENQDAHLLIVGDGPAKESVLSRAKMLNVSDKVTWTGIVNRNEVANYIAAFDIALQPEVVDYASPLKLFEYLALGKAIIAPDKANIREILTHDKNALLFNPDESNAIELAIKQLFSDEDLIRRLGSEAKALITNKNLTWLDNAKQVINLAKGLV